MRLYLLVDVKTVEGGQGYAVDVKMSSITCQWMIGSERTLAA